jgi:uncharacterized protein
VNALVALGFLEHEFHSRIGSWLQALKRGQEPELLTCPITELGFVRVLAHAQRYGFTVAQARTALAKLKKSNVVRFRFIADDRDVSGLPGWVRTARQTTDGHLLGLARAHGAEFATFDTRIPDAMIIPDA